MTSKKHIDTSRRHDFVLLFDIVDGNPNGDPDAGNLPRIDPETMHGLVTDVSLKRRLRDWVDALRGNEPRYKIYVQSGEALNAKHQRAYDDLGIRPTGTRQNRTDIDRAREWMCRNFYDIRVFGAVMTTGVNCGQVRGPFQLTFARSIDPITGSFDYYQGLSPSILRAPLGCHPMVLIADAMLVAPDSLRMPMTTFLKAAITCGAEPVRTREPSSPIVTSLT